MLRFINGKGVIDGQPVSELVASLTSRGCLQFPRTDTAEDRQARHRERHRDYMRRKRQEERAAVPIEK